MAKKITTIEKDGEVISAVAEITYKVESGVHMPVRSSVANEKFPFAEMKVGDSFVFLASKDYDKKKHSALLGYVRTYQNRFRRDNPGKEFPHFITGKDKDGNLRVWLQAFMKPPASGAVGDELPFGDDAKLIVEG